MEAKRTVSAETSVSIKYTYSYGSSQIQKCSYLRHIKDESEHQYLVTKQVFYWIESALGCLFLS